MTNRPLSGELSQSTATSTALFESEVDQITPVTKYIRGNMSSYYGSGNNPFDLVNNRVLFTFDDYGVNEPIYKNGISAVTLSCWSYIPVATPSALNGIVRIGDDAGMDFVSLWFDSAVGCYVIRTKHSEHRSSYSTLNRFVHLAVTATSSRGINLYIDGQPDRGLTTTFTSVGMPGMVMNSPKLSMGSFRLLTMNMKTDLFQGHALCKVPFYIRGNGVFTNSVGDSPCTITTEYTVPAQPDPNAIYVSTQRYTISNIYTTPTPADWSLSFWAKHTASISASVIFRSITNGTDVPIQCIVGVDTTGALGYNYDIRTGANYSTRFATGAAVMTDWHHVVIGHSNASGGTDYCFINGASVGIVSTLRTDSMPGFYSMVINNNVNINCYLKEIAFIKKVVSSASTAMLLMNGRVDTSPLIYWSVTAKDSMLSDIRMYDKVLTGSHVRQLALQGPEPDTVLNLNGLTNISTLTTTRTVGDVVSVGQLNVMSSIDQFTAEKASGWWVSSINDRSMNKCNLFKSSGASFATGFPYQMFLGNDYLTSDLPLSSTLSCSALSASFWVKMTSSPSGTFSVMALGDAASFLKVLHNESSSTMHVWTDRKQYTFTSLSANTPVHIGIVYDGYDLYLYLNGIIKTPSTTSIISLAKWFLTAPRIQFGYSHIDSTPVSNTLCLEDIRVFLGQILTTSQMNELYYAKTPGSQFPGTITAEALRITGDLPSTFGGDISVPAAGKFLQGTTDISLPSVFVYATVNTTSVASLASVALINRKSRGITFATGLSVTYLGVPVPVQGVVVPPGYSFAHIMASTGVSGAVPANKFYTMLNDAFINQVSISVIIGTTNPSTFPPFNVTAGDIIWIMNNDVNAATPLANQAIWITLHR